MSKEELNNILGVSTFHINSLTEIENNSWKLDVDYIFPYGHDESTNQESVLVKPFRSLLTEGKLIGKLKYIFYKEGNTFFTLGTFVKSKKYLLFFPGLVTTKLTKSPADGEFNDIMHIDHFSLEPNLRKWHITMKEKRTEGKRVKSKNTKRVSDTLFLWFVLGVKSIDKLEKTPKKQKIVLQSPNFLDLKRRHKEMINSRKNSIFHITELDYDINKNYYLNYEFFVSKEKLIDYPTIETIYTAKHLSSNKELPHVEKSRAHILSINDFSGSVYVRITKNPGILEEDAVIIPGMDYV